MSRPQRDLLRRLPRPLPLYTPLSDRWLNMAESIQHILVRRALAAQHPQTPAQLIAWVEETVDGCNQHPPPSSGTANARPLRKGLHMAASLPDTRLDDGSLLARASLCPLPCRDQLLGGSTQTGQPHLPAAIR